MDKIYVALLAGCVPRESFFVHDAFVVFSLQNNLDRVGKRYRTVVLEDELTDRRYPGRCQIW